MGTDLSDLILSVATEGFWDWDLKADIAYLSPRYCELTGYSAEETVFDSAFFKSIIHPDDREQVFAIMQEHLQGVRDISLIEYRMVARDGKVRWIEGRGKIVAYDEDGAPCRMVGTIVDVSERKKNEEALRKGQEELRVLFKILPVGISIVDMDRRILEMNPALERILGIDMEQLASGNYLGWRYLRSDGTPMPYDEIPSVRAIREQRDVLDVEMGIIKENGAIRWVSVSAAPLVGSGAVISTVDVTERKILTEKLRESEELYRGIFAVESDAILLVEVETGRVIDSNTAALQLYGYSQEEFMQLEVSRLSAESRKSLEAIAAHTTQVSLRWHCRKDGTVFPVEISGSYLAFRGRNIHVAAIRDISERIHADEEIQKLSTAIEQSPMAIVITDLAGNIEFVNPRFSELTGYSREEALFQNPRILKSGITPADVYTDLWNTVQNGGVWQGEFQNRKKDGTLYWESATITPIRKPDGTISNYLAIKEDITELKQARLEMLQYQSKLQDMASELLLAEERERWQIANMLHDQIGQTLALSVIRLGELKSLLVGSGKAGQIVDELRNLIGDAVSATRSLTFEISPPALYQIGLEAAIASLAETYRTKHGLSVDFVGCTEPVTLPLEANVLLYQSIRELLMNILKHAGAKCARITCRTTGNSYSISLEDDGKGLPPSVRDGKAAGYGIFSIRERLQHLNGSMVTESGTLGGLRVILTVPRWVEGDHGV
ncbi:MAG: PAS domain S-box protein [Geobacter sp.]|nr:PAS domain S-box protein [Geobacter sp.]